MNKMRFIHRNGRAVQVEFRFQPGVWYSTGTQDEYEAVEAAEELYNRLTGITVNKMQTLEEFAKGFYIPGRHGVRERLAKKNKDFSIEWFELQQGRIDNYIIPRFGNMLISGITTRMIDDWIIDLKSISKNKPLGSSTKIKILSAFSAIMNEAVSQELIPNNPIDRMIPLTERNKQREPFTREETKLLFPNDASELIKIWKGLDWAVFFLVMIETGLRPGEVAALHWEDYYPELQGFAVHRALRGRTREIKGLKTDRSGKRIKAAFISDFCANLLRQIRNDKMVGIVFSLKGRPLQIETTGKHFRICVDKSKVDRKGRTQYSLRHTFNTLALMSLPEESVRDMMGHTGYRREYDHRTGRDLLEKHKDIRGIMFNRMWG